MTHFDLTTLSDFARGVARPPDQSAIERHLADGCRRCADTVEWLRQFTVIASVDDQYEPPQAALRNARAAFSLVRPEQIRKLPLLTGRFTFDSFFAPATAGVRSSDAASPRRVLYEAGDFAVDLRFAPVPQHGKVLLVGQLANRLEPMKMVAPLPVLLTAGRTVVGRSSSNDFGEFQIEYRPRPGLRLQVPIENERRMEVSLDDMDKLGGPHTARRRKPTGGSRSRS